jgi:2-desacetyl-2-hydroxyethyl bacteriochlorophyllide A dehydrogenase
MLAAFWRGPGALELRRVPRPKVEPGQVLVQVRSCGICGSDLHVFTGGLPPAAVCPGHEISGEVVEVAADVREVHAGERVAIEPLVTCRTCAYCRTGDYQLCTRFQLLGMMVNGGFAEYVRIPSYAAFRLPATVDLEVGALTEPLAVGVHALRLARMRLGDRVLVLGAGTIGLLCVAAAKAAGASQIWVTARHVHQQEVARTLGASRVFGGHDGDAQLSVAATECPPDIVIETVGGRAATIDAAVGLVRPAGTVAVLGVFTGMAKMNPTLLMSKEVRLIGSVTYGRPGPRADFDVALDMLAADPEHFRRLITHRVPLTAITSGFETAADKRSQSIKVAVRPGI